MSHFKIYCEIAVSTVVVNRALRVGLIVGTTLNIINQGDIFLELDINHINILKFLLTYLVPYGVTTYTSTVMNLDFQIGSLSTVNANLECKECAINIRVTKGEPIPECSKCKLFTKWKLK